MKLISDIKNFYLEKFSVYIWRAFLAIALLLLFVSFFKIKDNTFVREPTEKETQFLDWRIRSAEHEDDLLVLPYSTDKSLSDFTITTKLPDLNSTSVLILRCRYNTITAKVDGGFVYASDFSSIAGISTRVGKDLCYIPLSKLYSNKDIEINIELQNLNLSKSTLSSIELSSRNTFIIEYLRANMVLFLTAILLFICSGGSFVFFLLSYFTNKKRMSSVSQSLFFLGVISILAAIWGLCDSHIFSLFTDKIVLDGILTYTSLILLALCFAEYFICLYGENKIIKVIVILARLNVIFQFIVFSTGLKDLPETIFLTHFIFLLNVLYASVMSIKNLVRYENSEKLLLNIENLLFAIFVAAILIMYLYNRDGPYSYLSVMAIIVYTTLQVAISVIKFIKTVKKQAALREAEKFAYTDQLTKMDNRRSYSVFKQHLGTATLPEDFNIIYFDLNGLKEINDRLGHNAGDEFIIGATDIIKKVFYDAQLKCRMGGDEFLVVIKASRDILKKRLFYFDSLIENWHGNLVHNISIAYGYCSAADYDNPTFESLISKADEFMYKNKNEYYEKTGKPHRSGLL